MKATIKLAHEVSEEACARVEAMVAHKLLYDCNWSGGQVDIEVDDFTCVDCDDELAGSLLLIAVNKAINDQHEAAVEKSDNTLILTDEDATELYYAFRNRGHSSTRVKVAEFLKQSDLRNGRESVIATGTTET